MLAVVDVQGSWKVDRGGEVKWSLALIPLWDMMNHGNHVVCVQRLFAWLFGHTGVVDVNQLRHRERGVGVLRACRPSNRTAADHVLW